MTVVLQMLVFVASALGFAAYVLKRDRRDKQRVDRENVQPSFDFPNYIATKTMLPAAALLWLDFHSSAILS